MIAIDQDHQILKVRYMAVKRDYGAFSKTAPKHLKPLITNLDFQQTTGAYFLRKRESWEEGFYLQQSGYGSGNFWVEIGLSVPGMHTYWQTDPAEKSFGFIVGRRLGINLASYHSEVYPAENADELKASLQLVAQHLHIAESWFSNFNTLKDVAKFYGKGNNNELSAANHAYLLLLAGEPEKAKIKLAYAKRKMQLTVVEHEASFKKRKPGKEALHIYELDLHRLKCVEAALRECD
ncbi:hypothetical protein ACO0LG_16085 [Undibacterium sp. Ji42W]|uniref:hypothetical protein n=1 Tax=Undibacterium sp. Ji42W TaxID=3413039 RepID=UPI003BF17894